MHLLGYVVDLAPDLLELRVMLAYLSLQVVVQFLRELLRFLDLVIEALELSLELLVRRPLLKHL